MSNYTKSTNFATKDTLPTGNAGKIVKGTEIDTEFNAIATAISSKADVASPTFTGTPSAPTAASGTDSSQIATTAFVQDALDAAGGSIIQTVVVTTTSASSTTAAQNVLAATSHSATITPTSASSKILVLVSGSVYVFGGSSPTIGVTTVYRGTTNLSGSGTAKFMTETGYSSTGDTGAVHMSFLDSPSSTSALTYRVYAGVTGGGSVEWNTSLFASMILMEIQ